MGIDQVLVIPTMVIMHVPFADERRRRGRVLRGVQRLRRRLVQRGAQPAVRRRVPARAGPAAHGAGDPPRRRARAARRPHPPDRRAGEVPERGGAVDDGTRRVRRRCSRRSRTRAWCSGMHTFPAPNYPHPLGRRLPGVAGRAVQPRRRRLADLLVRARDAGVAVAGAADRAARPLPEAQDGRVRVERRVAALHARDV